jgi:aryl-alcohol dehydrogenase-like predicted oxidoreductase
MRHVTLENTGITTTEFGFGCAGLMRPVEEKDRAALLEAAFDAGIRHFDVARYYGHGGAEGVLGKFLAGNGRRDEATITTKFGVEPSPLLQSSRGRSLMSMARRVASIHPAIHRLLSRTAQRGVRASRFDPESSRRSLETSLRELQTDRIDLFLLHEATLDDLATPGLYEFLEDARRAGKIRAFGLGSAFGQVPPILQQQPAFAAVVQVENSLLHPHLELLSPFSQPVITHGSLRALPPLEARLPAGEPRGTALAGLLLALAAHENPQGITLFSSQQPGRIRENVAVAERAAGRDAADWAAWKKRAMEALKAPAHVH